jgi:hypothetical protein
MPQAYQDAIHVTRALGLRYLWIDALCIIQDCNCDWRKECAKMGDTYKSSYVTIVPTANGSCSKGFLQPREGLVNRRRGWEDQIKLISKSHAPASSIFYLIERSFLDDIASLDPDWKGDIPGVWSTRGWTFQERQMSPRLLLFSENELYFECNQCRTNEAGACWTPLDTNRFISRVSNPQESDTDGYVDAYAEWYEIIAVSYSQRNFTKETDRFPALSGFAREWEAMINNARISDEYLAGLWKNDLPRGLLWRTYSDTHRPKEPVLPSWSWASVIGQVYWPWNNTSGVGNPDSGASSKALELSRSRNHPSCLKLLEHTCQASKEVPYGQVASGSLTVCGYVRKMRLSPASPIYPQAHLALLDTNGSPITYDDPRKDPLASAVEDITPDVKSEFVSDRNIWCFIVAGGRVPLDSSKMEYAGLLLDSVDDNEDCFKPFGYFRIAWENEKILVHMVKQTIVLI